MDKNESVKGEEGEEALFLWRKSCGRL